MITFYGSFDEGICIRTENARLPLRGADAAHLLCQLTEQLAREQSEGRSVYMEVPCRQVTTFPSFDQWRDRRLFLRQQRARAARLGMRLMLVFESVGEYDCFTKSLLSSVDRAVVRTGGPDKVVWDRPLSHRNLTPMRKRSRG